jgi:thiopeptide-type bacteriocin biosynthesis protein
LATLSDDAGKDAAWRLTLRGMDQLLDDLGLTLEMKHALVERCRSGFAKEFSSAVPIAKQIGERFRKERQALEAFLDRANDPTSELEPGLAMLNRRSERLQPIAQALKTAEEGGKLTTTIAQLAGSYLHMHANRILHSAARAQELVLYDFLERLYRGRGVRRKRS